MITFARFATTRPTAVRLNGKTVGSLLPETDVLWCAWQRQYRAAYEYRADTALQAALGVDDARRTQAAWRSLLRQEP